MFTGIIQGIARVAGVKRKPGSLSLQIEFPKNSLSNISRGASVAIDGVCLTVTQIKGSLLTFDVILESLNRTTLGTLRKGTQVNFERSLTFGQEVGGHILSGHIDGTAKIVKVETPKNNHIVTLSIEPRWMQYIFLKGYVALGGASLTIASVDRKKNTFSIYLIPETLRLTTFGAKKRGDRINFEIERQTLAIVDTVNNFLESKGNSTQRDLPVKKRAKLNGKTLLINS